MWSVLLACAPYEPPEGALLATYDVDGALTTFPDDLHTVDADTVTGLAVKLQDGALTALADTLPPGVLLVPALESLDGFGLNGAIQLAFEGPIDPARFVPHLGDLESGTERPVSVQWTSDGQTVVLQPMFPLEAVHSYGVLVTDVFDATGAEVWPPADLWDLLHGKRKDDARFARLHPRYRTLLDVAGVDEDAVDAATVFTTQSIHEQDDAVMDALDDAPPTISGFVCADEGTGFRRCEGVLHATRFVGDSGTVEAAADGVPSAKGSYDVPVSVWLPGVSGDPLPLVIYGHGMGGDRGEANGYARDQASVGFVVASIDAPYQGDHPLATHSGTLLTTLDFFGVDISNVAMDVAQLRDHFRVAAWDKEQLVRAFRAARDVDGDGVDDLDGRVAYAGHSQGAIMGVQLLGMDPTVESAELSCGGARVSDIVHSGSQFQILVDMMRPSGVTEDDLLTFFPILQAAIDRGDPGSYATAAREGDRDFLLQMVMNDDTVPNSTNEYLARALHVDLGPPAERSIDGVDELASLPASANDDGRTAVMFQFSQMMSDDGTLVPASHGFIHDNEVSVPQIREFWRSRLDDGRAVVINPWTTLP